MKSSWLSTTSTDSFLNPLTSCLFREDPRDRAVPYFGSLYLDVGWRALYWGTGLSYCCCFCFSSLPNSQKRPWDSPWIFCVCDRFLWGFWWGPTLVFHRKRGDCHQSLIFEFDAGLAMGGDWIFCLSGEFAEVDLRRILPTSLFESAPKI